jgi:hypothetical protein
MSETSGTTENCHFPSIYLQIKIELTLEEGVANIFGQPVDNWRLLAVHNGVRLRCSS